MSDPISSAAFICARCLMNIRVLSREALLCFWWSRPFQFDDTKKGSKVSPGKQMHLL
jgi:hypothetical protein